MCVILFTTRNGKLFFAKNRDRGYQTNIKIIHEMINGNEVVYLLDEKTGWIEGMNEHGLAIINSTTLMQEDYSRKSILKNPIYNALKQNHLNNFDLEGNSLVHFNNKVYHIGLDVKIVKKQIVLTNDKKLESSRIRQKMVENELNKNTYNDLLHDVMNVYYPNVKSTNQPYRHEKHIQTEYPNKIPIFTTGQILYNITDKIFVYYYDTNATENVEYINKMKHKSKIKVIIKPTQKKWK